MNFEINPVLYNIYKMTTYVPDEITQEYNKVGKNIKKLVKDWKDFKNKVKKCIEKDYDKKINLKKIKENPFNFTNFIENKNITKKNCFKS